MSQSDMIPAVISLLSSDDDAGPSKRQDSSSKDKPKKKISRKKRAPGTKTKNAKNLSSTSAAGKTDLKAEQLKHNGHGSSKTLVKTVPLPPSSANKPVIEDKDGLLKQFETRTAGPKRESPLRSAVKVRKPKAPTIKTRSMLKDMTDFGTSGASVSSTENEKAEESDKPSEYAKLFVDDDVKDLVSSSICSDSGDVSDLMFESIFNEKVTPKKGSPTFHPSDHYTSPVSDAKLKTSSDPTGSNVSTMSPLPLSKQSTLPDSSSTPSKQQRRPITITNSPEGSPIDLSSSPESDSTRASITAEKKTPESKTLKSSESPKKAVNKPLKSSLKRSGEQRKTKTCSIPGQPDFTLPETKKKRKISLDEYKAKTKGTPSQMNPSENPETDSLPTKPAENIDKMPSFYVTDDELEIPTSSPKTAKKESPPKNAIDHFKNYNSYKNNPKEPKTFTPAVPKASEAKVANSPKKKESLGQINGDASSGKDRRRKSSRNIEKKADQRTPKEAAKLPEPRKSPRTKVQETSSNLSCLKRPKKTPVQKALDASISAQGKTVTKTTDTRKTAESVETSAIKAKPNVNTESSEKANTEKIEKRRKRESSSFDGMSTNRSSLQSPKAANLDDPENPPKKKSRPRVELQTAAYRQSHPTPVVDLLSSPKKDEVNPANTTSASSAESKGCSTKPPADKIADNRKGKSISTSSSSDKEVLKSNKRPKLTLSASPEGELVTRTRISAAKKLQEKQKSDDKGSSSTSEESSIPKVIPSTTPQKATPTSSTTPSRGVPKKILDKDPDDKSSDKPKFTSILDELEDDEVEPAPIDFGSATQPETQVKTCEVPIVTLQSPQPSSQNPPPVAIVTPVESATEVEKMKEKPVNLRVQQIAEEEEEFREPDSIDDDLPLEAFVEKRDNKEQDRKKFSVLEENKQTEKKNLAHEKDIQTSEKENHEVKKTNGDAGKAIVENSVSKSVEKSKSLTTPASKTSVAKTLPSKAKRQKSDGEKKTRKKEKRRPNTTTKSANAKTPQKSVAPQKQQTEVVNCGYILDSDEEREREASKMMTEMMMKIKQENSLSFSQEQLKAASGKSSNQSASTSNPAASSSDIPGSTPDPSKSGDQEAFKEFKSLVESFKEKFDARSATETPGFEPMFEKAEIPACKSTRKDKEYFDRLNANPQLLEEYEAPESFYKGDDYSRELPNERHDPVLRAKMQKEFDVVEVERNKRKDKFGYYEDRQFPPGSADEKEMKKARDAFIEIDQKYASLDAELNGPPVIKEVQLEACKETDDNLFMMRTTVPFMAPYRYDNNEVKKAHYQQWCKDASGNHKPRKIEIERDSKLWVPAKSIVAGRRHCQRGNEVEDGHKNLMTSSYSTINGKISQLISWKKNDLKDKFDQMFPEPSYDPALLSRTEPKPVPNPMPPATSDGTETKEEAIAPIKDEDPPGFSSDEENKPEDNKLRAKVTFNNPQTPQTSRITVDSDVSSLSPAIVPPVRKDSRSKSLGSINPTREVSLAEENPERRKSFSVDSGRDVTKRPGGFQVTIPNTDDQPSNSNAELEDLVVTDDLHKHRHVTVSKKTFVKGADLSIKK